MGRKFSCITIYIDDTLFIANTFGIPKLNAFLTDVANFLKKSFSYSNVFSRQNGCFCIFLSDNSESALNKAITTLNNRFQKTWSHDNVELKLYIRLCIIECPRDAESAEEIVDIINMIISILYRYHIIKMIICQRFIFFELMSRILSTLAVFYSIFLICYINII